MSARSIVVVLLVLLVAASATKTKKPKGTKKRLVILENEVAALKEIIKDVVGHSESGFEHSGFILTRTECPAGWTDLFSRSCLKRLPEPGNFQDSQTACRELHDDADVAIPRNKVEEEILINMTSGSTLWAGVVRAEHGKPGFVDTKGGVLLWEHWNNGEPNDFGAGENCVEVIPTGFWNDVPCSIKRQAVCQINKVDIKIDRQIVFERSFTAPPKVILSVTAMGANKDANLRYNVRAVGVTTDGFRMKMETYADTHVYQARVDWMAVPDLSASRA